jgi:hypothetical protein
MIIGLTGVAQSGKSSVAHILVNKYGFKQYSFAEGVYEALYRLDPTVLVISEKFSNTVYPRLRSLVDEYGWDEAKQHKSVRELLQRMGTECGRELHGEDVWVDRTFNKILTECDIEFQKGFLHIKTDIVIADVRFDNEARKIKWYGEGHVVEVDRGLGPVNYHKSEAGVSPSLIDGEIGNTGTLADLEYNVEKMLEFIGYEKNI